ncbi:pyridoxamine 5'-phosphate oxidase family protein [Pseudolysinimonas sp.]|uniref:pyridoxamine 5'-phosphate oxidase family protein n=1 Tax=Pseudolysinimonas sp. TaxID=2680009 RepID=UPI003F7DF737
MTIDPRTQPADVISEEECWRRLAGERIGRFAVESGGGPRIFPVNHLVLDGAVVFRSGPGLKMLAGSAHPRAAFEVDGRDQDEFWSVVVDGDVTILGADDPSLLGRLDDLVALHPSPKHMVIRLRPRSISGRRFLPPQPGSLWNA